MPFEKGKPKTGGRKPGTPNRITVAVREQLEASNCNPISVLIRVMRSSKTEPALKVRVAAELARYCYPQLRSIELRTPPGSPLEVNVVSARESLARRIAGIAARTGTDGSDSRPDGTGSESNPV